MSDATWCFIIPYRDRADHLSRFVRHYRPLFHSVPIFVIEQADGKPFNRGKLLNVGVREFGLNFPYFCLSDVDMYVVPETADYSVPTNPTHLATQCSQFNYAMPYPDYFGGVNLFTREQFQRVNGFSNNFWGWGAEDDLLRKDFLKAGFLLDRRPCRFECADHPRPMNQALHQQNLRLLNTGRNPQDGLQTCAYTVTATFCLEDYTHLQVTL